MTMAQNCLRHIVIPKPCNQGCPFLLVDREDLPNRSQETSI